MAVPFTYDLATNVGKVRMLIADTDEDTHAFTDAELEAILTLEGSNLKRAAAGAFLVLAGQRAKLAVRVGRGATNEDLTQVAKELREQAATLREQADAEDEDGCLEANVSPSYERFSARSNELMGRTGDQLDWEDFDEVRMP